MARYTDADCRLCRRTGEKLFLKGERCHTPKCAIDRRKHPPGEHISMRRKRVSDTGIQLKEKQKARYTYGLMEKQFRSYFVKAQKSKDVTGDALLALLEQRLDNVVYRASFADSRDQARQLVCHGHFDVNGKRLDIPSYNVKIGDVIGWRETSKKTEIYKWTVESLPKRVVPVWLDLDVAKAEVKIQSIPGVEDIAETIDTRLIVEHYSR
jgi:small subunit ribosomal protein S4